MFHFLFALFCKVVSSQNPPSQVTIDDNYNSDINIENNLRGNEDDDNQEAEISYEIRKDALE